MSLEENQLELGKLQADCDAKYLCLDTNWQEETQEYNRWRTCGEATAVTSIKSYLSCITVLLPLTVL